MNKSNEDMLLKEALTRKLAHLNPEAFWREIKARNSCNTPLPSSIEGISCRTESVDLWRKRLLF